MELSPQIHTEILNLITIPVTNGNDALLGIVTFDDAHDVAEAEATTDFHRMGSVSLMSTRLREASIGPSVPPHAMKPTHSTFRVATPNSSSTLPLSR